ncbi:MAG: TetR/AcrR family transcriptional regulator [Pseudomonadales bacterium]|nr:TetR/AcrR family transcriptional regulator [Pseudomonadales bacterium]
MSKILGRPRSQAADDAIIAAATKIFYKQSYQDVSMEAIAIEAGVGKATLYRRWANKATLAVEVLMRQVIQEKTEYSSGNYRQHLISNLMGLRDMLSSEYADVIICVIAETQYNPELRTLFDQHFLKPVQAIGEQDLKRAIQQGEIKDIVDHNLLFDQLFGLFYYRILVVQNNICDKDIYAIVDAFLALVGINNSEK